MKIYGILIVAVLFLALASFGLAEDVDLKVTCAADADCLSNAAFLCGQEACYCSQNSCFLSTEDGTSGIVGDELDEEAFFDNLFDENETEVVNVTPTDETLETLQAGVEALQVQSLDIEDRLALVESKTAALETNVAGLQSNIKSLNSQQQQLKGAVEKQLNTVATGLAGLQKDVGSTKQNVETIEEGLSKEQSLSRLVLFILIVLAIALITGVVILYSKTTKMKSQIDPEIIRYITQQIKQGKKYNEIRNLLTQAGWQENDIKEAYQATVKANYQKYKQQSTGSGEERGAEKGIEKSKPQKKFDSKKIAALAGLGIILIVGVIFLLQGVTTGQAIHFQNIDQLDTAVKERLENSITRNEFYEKIGFADICVQVNDGENAVSYRVIKTPRVHQVTKVEANCDVAAEYQLAAKFTSWNAFDLASSKLSCANIKRLHDRKMVYTLPSQLILPGFFINQQADVTGYCTALKTCLSDKELQAAGIIC